MNCSSKTVWGKAALNLDMVEQFCYTLLMDFRNDSINQCVVPGADPFEPAITTLERILNLSPSSSLPLMLPEFPIECTYNWSYQVGHDSSLRWQFTVGSRSKVNIKRDDS